LRQRQAIGRHREALKMVIDRRRTRVVGEIRRRTRVVGAFPDGQSALNLAAARLRHIAGTAWSTKRYLNIELLKDQQMRGAITA
jgi:transposase-like protein